MTNEQAKKMLKAKLECLKRETSGTDFDCNNSNCEDAIKALPSAQPEQRWIPCSERLPEEGEDIIVTYVDDEETRIIPVNYDKGTWYDCIFDTALNPIKVIAWMPLPEPYKRGEQYG